MIQLNRIAKNMKFLYYTIVLLFSLLGLSITPIPSTYAAAQAIPSIFSSNWSGLEAAGPIGTFRKSQCTATVPKITTRGDVSVWCGLGGDPSAISPNNPTQGSQKAVLVQAGIDACLDDNCIGTNCQRGVQCNDAWWEIADALVSQTIRFTQGVHVGDVFYVYMQSNLHDDNTDLFYIKNQTTGESHTIRVTDQGATKDGTPIRIVGPRPNRIPVVSDGASVECIVERPLNAASNSFLKLPDFQSTTVTGCDDGKVGQAVLEPITSNSTVTTISMFDKPKGANAQGSGVTVLAAPQQPFARTPGIVDSFNVVQPSANPSTQATRRNTLETTSSSPKIISPVSSRRGG